MTLDWQKRALCRTQDPELFFRNGVSLFDAQLTVMAQDVCDVCPVKRQCFGWIMQIEEGFGETNRFGVYAGYTPKQRYRIFREERRRAARAAAS